MKTEAGLCHDMIKEEITPSMSFDENADFFQCRADHLVVIDCRQTATGGQTM